MSSSSAHDRRQLQWGRDIYPEEKDLDPLPFERPDAPRELIAAAEGGLSYFRSLGLSGEQIDKLVVDIRRERTTTRREASWPSLAEDKTSLRRIVHHAEALSSELAKMSMRVEISLNGV